MPPQNNNSTIIIGLLIIFAVLCFVIYVVFVPRVYYVNGLKYTIQGKIPENTFLLTIRKYLGYKNINNYIQEISVFDVYRRHFFNDVTINYFKGTISINAPKDTGYPPLVMYLNKSDSIENMNTALTNADMADMARNEKTYDDLTSK